MRIWLVLALSACGRIDFDARDAAPPDLDAPLGHDEDGDGFADVDDNCPHVANDQTDTDFDTVGDMCDPNSTVARQRLIYFTALASGSSPFSQAGSGLVTLLADSLAYDGNGAIRLSRPIACSDCDVWVGVDVLGFHPGTSRQLAVTFHTTVAMPHVYAETYESTTSPAKIGAGHYDGSSYTSLSSTPLPTTFPTGRLTFTVLARASSSRLDVVLDEPAGRSNAIISTGLYTGSPNLSILFDDLIVELRYFAVIETY